MKKNSILLAALPLLFTAAAAFAQSPQSSITESTDPARAAAVERRAQDLRSGQSTMGADGQAQMRQSASGEQDRMHDDGMRHHGRHHGRHHERHRKHQDHPKAAPHSGK